MKNNKTGFKDLRVRKKGYQLAAPKLSCGPGDNCKSSCNAAINLMNSILSRGTNDPADKNLEQMAAMAIREELMDP